MMPLQLAAPPEGELLHLEVEASLTRVVAPAVFPDPFEDIVETLEGLPLVVIDPFGEQAMVELRGTF